MVAVAEWLGTCLWSRVRKNDTGSNPVGHPNTLAFPLIANTLMAEAPEKSVSKGHELEHGQCMVTIEPESFRK